MKIDSPRNHGINIVSIKDPHLLSLRRKMGGYLEDILHKVGLRSMEMIIITSLMTIRPGCFLLTILHNLKSQNQKRQYSIVAIIYLLLEVALI